MPTLRSLAWLLLLLCCLTCAALPASAGDPPLPWGDTPSPAAAYARVAAITALGRTLFFDPGLSASGRQACAIVAARVDIPTGDLRGRGGLAIAEMPGLRCACEAAESRDHGDAEQRGKPTRAEHRIRSRPA